MGELTLEALAARLTELENKIGTATTDAAAAVQTANEAKSIVESVAAIAAAGAKVANINAAKEAVKYEIPEGEFKHNGKKYVFLKSKFRLAGDPALHISQEAAATAGKKDGIFDRILKLEGQDILKEVV